MRTGLVMEGGAMRGMFTCGVLDVLMEKGIHFDAAVGVSAGAAFGCNIKSGQIGRALRYNMKYCGDKRYAGIESLLRTGNIFNAKFCYETLPNELDPWDAESFAANPMEFYVVATDANTGEAVYHKCSDGKARDIQWIRASASMPLVSKPVELEGGIYLDGGIADSIPLRFMERKGCDRILVIETRPADYRKSGQQFLGLIRTMMRRYPNLVRAMENRAMMYNEEKDYVQRRGKEDPNICVIQPASDLGIGHMEKHPEELQRVYRAGRVEAVRFLDNHKEWLIHS